MGLQASAKTMAFVVTGDRARAVAFYTGVLGFRLTGEDDFAAVLDLTGVMLRMATAAGHVPAGHTVLGWEVDDIEACVRGLRDAGVTFKVYEGFGQDAKKKQKTFAPLSAGVETAAYREQKFCLALP